MIVRPYTSEDLETVKRIHRESGLDYELPDIEGERFACRAILERDGQARMAAFSRLTTENYLLVGKDAGSPKEKWEGILALNEAMSSCVASQGIADAHCWVEPELARVFGKRLKALGWERAKWVSFTKNLRGK